MEEELSELADEDAKEYLEAMGVADSGVTSLIQATYDLLGLASFLTAGEKEARAWTFRKGMTAPQCAGVIHTDLKRIHQGRGGILRRSDFNREHGSSSGCWKIKTRGRSIFFADGALSSSNVMLI